MSRSNAEIKGVLIHAENIGLRFGDKQILDNVNFDVHDVVRPGMVQGQIVSLIGRSGIGKTQMFKIMSGLMPPTTGVVKIDVDQHPVQAGQVGVVPQDYILFNHRTIYNNLLIGLNHSKENSTSSDKAKIIEDYAERFELTDHLKKYPMQLSGGQRQRVSIIQQILTGNKFILLDEPYSGLDAIMKDKVIELLVKISCTHEYTTLVIVSHDIENSLAISDTAFILARPHNATAATITKKIDLIELGLAWEADIRTKPEFIELCQDIKTEI